VADLGNWNSVIQTMFIQGKECKNTRLKIYIWNKGLENLLVGDLEYKVYNVGRHSPFNSEQLVWSSE
jgi:hypothetical protein